MDQLDVFSGVNDINPEDPDLIDEKQRRLDAEWLTVNAIRETIGIARPSGPPTYEQTFEFAKEFAPKLFEREESLLISARENPIIKKYAQIAEIESKDSQKVITAAQLIDAEIAKYERYIKSGRRDETNELRKEWRKLVEARQELILVTPSENQMINRDMFRVPRDIPLSRESDRYKEFRVSRDRFLSARLLHPDTPEHITGADVIYEFYWESRKLVRIIVVQYKMWNGRRLRKDERMERQVTRMKQIFCHEDLCEVCYGIRQDGSFRFPHTVTFIRPTDRLQSADSNLISSAYHIPSCIAKNLWHDTDEGKSQYLEAHEIKALSVRQQTFEDLFLSNMIGSRWLSYAELNDIYENKDILSPTDKIVIHARELSLN